MRLDVDAVLLGHVAHVEPNDQRCVQCKHLRNQVEAALQRSGVNHHDGNIGALSDEIIARDALLFGVCAQAVGAGQVDQVDGAPLVIEHAGLLLDRLAGPIAHVLVQPGQHVEHGRLADVRLADQRNRQCIGCGVDLRAAVMAGRLDEMQLRLVETRLPVGTADRYAQGYCHHASFIANLLQ